MSGHSHIDRWSLLMHGVIAERIERGDPEPVRIARANLDRWRSANGSLDRAQAEWSELLMLPSDRLGALLRQDGDDATRLRSNSPFAGVLDTTTRLELFHEARGA